MKTCPKCKTEHSNKGLFCSRRCANSRSFSIDSIQKKSEANKKFWGALSEAQRKDIQASNLLKYDFEEQQRKAQETKLLKSWSRPYEEMSHDSVRRRLLAERNYTCEECGIGSKYNGKPLSLELDHIDGNSSNNKIENLRILCPNCHSQTPTHRSKNIRHKRLLAEQKNS